MIGFSITTCLIVFGPFAWPVFCSSVAQCTTKRQRTINGKRRLAVSAGRIRRERRWLKSSLEGDSTNHEQIDGRDPSGMIAQECVPTLRGWFLPPGHVPRHG